MISEIFVNGDSYSAASDITIPYSVHLGDLFSATVTNFAKAGSSNDRIIRTTLEYCLSLSAQQKPLIVIGFSFVTREETWLEDPSDHEQKIKDFPGSKFVPTDWLINQSIDEATKHLIIDQNINKQMIYFYTKLFMLTQTLKQLRLPYFLFSAANNQDFRNLNWTILKNLNVYNQLLSDKCVEDMHNFNIRFWAETNKLPTESTYHLYNDGHKKFAEFLYKKINDIICQR